MTIGFLSLGVALLAELEVDSAVGCVAAGCDAAVCDEPGFVDVLFDAVVLDAVDLAPLCFRVGRSGSSAGADASAELWFASEDEAAGVGVGEAAGDALLSGRCR